LLKAGEVLRALQSATIRRAEAERLCRAAEHARRVAEGSLEELKTRVAAEQGRLDRLHADVAEAQQGLQAAHRAAEELLADVDREIGERQKAADDELAEFERQHRGRRAELEAVERDLVERIDALRSELHDLAAKAGAL
jgi:chromosome segregation ATPase